MNVDAIRLIAAEHRELLTLIARACDAHTAGHNSEATALLAEACLRLRVHDAVEEHVLYPIAASLALDARLLAQVELEHSIVRALLAEIDASNSMTGDEPWSIVAELEHRFAHHAHHEEAALLVAMAQSGADVQGLARDFTALRAELRATLAFEQDVERPRAATVQTQSVPHL